MIPLGVLQQQQQQEINLALFEDTFTDVDSTALSAHTPDVGTGWTQFIHMGGVQISGNKAVPQGTTEWGCDETLADCVITGDVHHGNSGDEADLKFRNNAGFVGGWALSIKASTIELWHGTNNSNWALQDSDSSLGSNVNTTRSFKIVLTGGHITCYVDDALMFENSNKSLQGNALHGIRFNKSGANWIDNFKVEPLSLLDGLVSWWTMAQDTGDILDSHGINDLVRQGSGSGTIPGKVGDATEFGNTGFCGLTGATGVDAHLGSFHMGCWVRMNSAGTADGIMTKGGGAGTAVATDYLILAWSNKFRWYVQNGSGTWYYIEHPITFAIDTWYFVEVWWDDDTQTSGINVNRGTPATYYLGFTPSNSSNEFRIGAYSGSPYILDGDIDEAFFYKRLLTSDESDELYNSGDGITYADI